jgi:DNA repair photolyase
MAKSNGNMYEWITHTANPLAGECIHNCSYCYVQKLKRAKPVIAEKYKGSPKLDFNGLKQISGKGKFIFVCDMTDLFADNVPYSVIDEILKKCKQKDENRYLLQTKNTKRMFELKWMFDDEIWMPEIHNSHYEKLFSICTTFETNRFYPEIMKNVSKPMDRILDFQRLGFASFNKYITIEPIMDFDLDIMVKEIKGVLSAKQVNIGADSGNNHLPEPTKVKILQLIKELEKFTIVKQKSNLARLLV